LAESTLGNALCEDAQRYPDKTRLESGGAVTARSVQIDPDVGLPDLVKSLTDDSKRLVKDEVRLAKLEAAESARTAAKGAMWLGVAFGVGIVMLIALTIAVASGIGQVANGNMWLGALVAGAIEIGLGLWLIKRGLSSFSEPSYTFEETRAGLKETVEWVGDARSQSRAVTIRGNGRS
jgi:hypothetical protein